MTDPARRLLSLLGVLPDGIARTDLEMLLPGLGNAAAATLRQVAWRSTKRDACARSRRSASTWPLTIHPRLRTWRARSTTIRGLARELGPKCGDEGGAEAVARLSAETANIENMLLSGLKRLRATVGRRSRDRLRRIPEVLRIGNGGAAGPGGPDIEIDR